MRRGAGIVKRGDRKEVRGDGGREYRGRRRNGGKGGIMWGKGTREGGRDEGGGRGMIGGERAGGKRGKGGERDIIGGRRGNSFSIKESK